MVDLHRLFRALEEKLIADDEFAETTVRRNLKNKQQHITDRGKRSTAFIVR